MQIYLIVQPLIQPTQSVCLWAQRSWSQSAEKEILFHALAHSKKIEICQTVLKEAERLQTLADPRMFEFVYHS